MVKVVQAVIGVVVETIEGDGLVDKLVNLRQPKFQLSLAPSPPFLALQKSFLSIPNQFQHPTTSLCTTKTSHRLKTDRSPQTLIAQSGPQCCQRPEVCIVEPVRRL